MKTHRHRESVKPTIPRLDDLVGPGDGWFVEPATIDPEVGEEVVIFLRAQASKIEKLCRIEPFLGIRPGIWRNLYGQVGYILFWLSAPKTPDVPMASSVKCFDPHSEEELSLWRRLADQGHWHLFLVTGNEMRDFIYFDNNFDLDKGLKQIAEWRTRVPEGYPIKTRELFMEQLSVEDLMSMPDGHSSQYLVFSKSGA